MAASSAISTVRYLAKLPFMGNLMPNVWAGFQKIPLSRLRRGDSWRSRRKCAAKIILDKAYATMLVLLVMLRGALI